MTRGAPSSELVAEKLGETYFGKPPAAAAVPSRRQVRSWRWVAVSAVAVGLLGLGGIAVSITSHPLPARLPLADFDNGAAPLRSGGAVGTWLSHPEDRSQSCRISYDPAHGRGGLGQALRIAYDVDSDQPAMTGVWFTPATPVRIRGYDTLHFALRTEPVQGATRTLAVVLRTAHHRLHYPIHGLTTTWRGFAVPLADLEHEPLQEVLWFFEDQAVTQRVGTLYLDDLQLRRGRGTGGR